MNKTKPAIARQSRRKTQPTGMTKPVARGERDPGTQCKRFIARARELVLDEREETFDAALTKVARHRTEPPG